MSKQSLNKTNLSIAIQYLVARKKQSVLAIIGVLLGVTTFIVMINFMSGVNDFLDNAVFKGNPDIVIKPTSKQNTAQQSYGFQLTNLEGLEEINRQLREHTNVTAYANQTISPAILVSNSQQLPGSVNGIFPIEEKNMVDLDKRLIAGKGFDNLTEKNILMGVSLAKKLQVSVNDTIKIILPNGKNTTLTVSGIFSFGITTIDNVRTYISAKTLQHLLGRSEIITHVNVKLKDRDNLDVKTLLLKKLKSIEIEDWKQNNKTIVVGNKVRDILTWSVSFALLLVAGFGIYNIQNSTVIHKRKDIAVLKTIGYTSEDIIFIFLIQAIIIGLIGAFLALGVGYLISFFISITPLDTSDFIIVDTYPINFSKNHFAIGFLFGVLTTILSGYFPSRKASKVDPVTIIRGV